MGYLSKCSSLLKTYLKRRFGKEAIPYSHQLETWKKLTEVVNEDLKVIVLKAPTSAGKTEAAIIPYIYQIVQDDWFIAPAVIYVLPNRSLIFSQFKRIKNMIQLLLPEELRKRVYITVDIGGLVGRSTQSPDTYPYYEKTFLFGDIVFTTLDAFFYSLIAQRTFLSRNKTLGKALFPVGNVSTAMVVFDEVQMYQDEYYYTPQILRKLFEVLYKNKVPTIVMTATLPSILERKIFKRSIQTSPIIAERSPYTRRIKVNLHTHEDMITRVNALVTELITKNDTILIVVNKVKRAIEVYLKLVRSIKNLNADIDIIHSRLKESTRWKREEKLEELERESKRKYSKKILIATQVAESGLDYNFDVLITEIAPIDAIIQRVGRVGRRSGEGEAHIFRPEDEKPYTEYIIEATFNAISRQPEKLKKAIDNLVEAQNLLDTVYRENFIRELRGECEEALSRTLKLLDSLGPFLNISVFPDTMIRTRCRTYITLLVPNDIILKNIKNMLKEPSLTIEVEKNVILGSTFNLNYIGNDIEQYPFLRFDNKVLKVDIRRGDYKSMTVQLEVQKVEQVRPLEVYIVNPEWYKVHNGYELGLLYR
ncbi:CRISPR-associated helicase Cas3' [archaeon]|nr:MAG: CRISPR-associated helicase Cas3' [archaeon]